MSDKDLKCKWYVVELSFEFPRPLMLPYSPRFSVHEIPRLLFPPDDWTEIQRETHENRLALQMFVKTKKQIGLAKRKLARELKKEIRDWTKDLRQVAVKI